MVVGYKLRENSREEGVRVRVKQNPKKGDLVSMTREGRFRINDTESLGGEVHFYRDNVGGREG